MPLLISNPIEKGGLGFNTTRIGAIGKRRKEQDGKKRRKKVSKNERKGRRKRR